MSFDRSALIDACRRHGRVARVVVARTRGSAPREVGAAMLVWQTGMSGTIGGGTLEFEALRRARQALEGGQSGLTHHALGPQLGQCCGGAVDLLTEVYDLESAECLPKALVVRGPGLPPMAVERLKTAARAQGLLPEPQLIDRWMIEPVTQPQRDIWIWGAGHVGRALATVLVPLPDFRVTVIDTHKSRFPSELPAAVQQVVAAKPELIVPHSPPDAEHLIVTYSHALDLELCHRLLHHGFAFAGLIGSATKWARFRRRLGDLGHAQTSISRITCPIGRRALGKHPQQIALGVATALLERKDHATTVLEGHG